MFNDCSKQDKANLISHSSIPINQQSKNFLKTVWRFNVEQMLILQVICNITNNWFHHSSSRTSSFSLLLMASGSEISCASSRYLLQSRRLKNSFFESTKFQIPYDRRDVWTCPYNTSSYWQCDLITWTSLYWIQTL